MRKYTCKHCKHRWLPRTSLVPSVCPACGSHNWNKAPQVKFRKKDKVVVRIGGWTFSDEEE